MKRYIFLFIVVSASITFLSFIDIIEKDPVFIVNDTHYYIGEYIFLYPPNGREGGYLMTGFEEYVKEIFLPRLYIIRDPDRRPAHVIYLSEILDKKRMNALADDIIEDVRRRSHTHGRDTIYRIYLSQIIDQVEKEIK